MHTKTMNSKTMGATTLGATTVGAMTALLMLIAGEATAQAPALSADQTGVWTVVQESWARDQAKDTRWMEEGMAAGSMAWNNEWPTPRGKAALRRWADFYNKGYTMQIHELVPQAVSIDGDTALVHYMWSAVYEAADGESDDEHGRCSDTLVRRGGSWKFLGWSCAPLSAD